MGKLSVILRCPSGEALLYLEKLSYKVIDLPLTNFS